jgi:hypothetical protein
MLPDPHAVRVLMEDLLGRDVTVSLSKPVVAADLPRTAIAVYADGPRITAVAALELPLAAYAGAALGLMPAGGAQDAIDEGTLPSTLADNVHELCNVLCGLLNRTAGEVHHKLVEVHLPGDPLPPDAAARTLALGQRLDLTVEIARYGGGRLSIIPASPAFQA